MITKDEIAASGFDYLALGHVHVWDEWSLGSTIACYPGSPVQAFASSRGGFYALVDLDPESGVSVSKRRVSEPPKRASEPPPFHFTTRCLLINLVTISVGVIPNTFSEALATTLKLYSISTEDYIPALDNPSANATSVGLQDCASPPASTNLFVCRECDQNSRAVIGGGKSIRTKIERV